MLITKQQLFEATELQLWEVRAALLRGGEPDIDNEIKRATFRGMTLSGHLVYEIAYDYEGALATGNVYLKFVQAGNEYAFEGTS
jgi:hypothetical protein